MDNALMDKISERLGEIMPEEEVPTPLKFLICKGLIDGSLVIINSAMRTVHVVEEEK